MLSLAEALNDSEDRRVSVLTFTGVDHELNTLVPTTEFQFFPETISIAQSVDYADKQIIGGSHPLKHWSTSSGRTISFSFLISRDIAPLRALPPGARLAGVSPSAQRALPFNRDIRQFLDRMTAMCLPDYKTDGAEDIATPPPIALFRSENLGWSLYPDDRDLLIGVITSLSITYKRLFEDGTPRQASGDISISELIQIPGGETKFVGRSDLIRGSPWWDSPFQGE